MEIEYMSTTSSVSESVERLLEASQQLSIAERVQLADAIWQTLPAETWSSSPTDLDELHRRLDAYDRDPSIAISEEEMSVRLAALRDQFR